MTRGYDAKHDTSTPGPASSGARTHQVGKTTLVGAPPVPSAAPAPDEVVNPAALPSLDGASSAALREAADGYVDAYYNRLHRALASAIGALRDPPPPAERPIALRILGALVESLVGVAMGHLTAGVVAAGAARGVAQPSLDMVKDQLKSLSGGFVERFKIAAPGSVRALPAPGGDGVANPAAKTLLEEFETRMGDELDLKKARARTVIAIAGDRVNAKNPAAFRALLEGLDERTAAITSGADFQQDVTAGWLNFCASLALGPRKAGETIMPGANEIGGSNSSAWRFATPGLVEIHIEVPDEIRGIEGLALGAVAVALDGGGAARILRQSKLKLDQLPVYRRVWFGQDKLDTHPELVITPEHDVEVNANSSLLAAFGSGAHGTFRELQFEGRSEEVERKQLLEKAKGMYWRNPSENDGPLGPVMAGPQGGLTHPEEERVASLMARRHNRLEHSQLGARKLVQWLHQFGADRISA